LIFAAPGESLAEWESDLDRAIALSPDHVSTYGLTFERGTQFWNRRRRGDLTPADEELERAMYESAIGRLTAAGFEHYEVSNFARRVMSPFAPRKDGACAERKKTKRCRHNEAYWLGEEYFAAGPGAARYVAGVRSVNHRSTTTYIRRVLAGDTPIAESERLAPRERALEVLVFALRRLEGVERRWFEQKTGLGLETVVGDGLRECAVLGLMEDDGRRVRLTREGLLVSDAIFTRLLSKRCGVVLA
jgi:oxygen-independent coproporphyrinogen-3 oxidase